MSRKRSKSDLKKQVKKLTEENMDKQENNQKQQLRVVIEKASQEVKYSNELDGETEEYKKERLKELEKKLQETKDNVQNLIERNKYLCTEVSLMKEKIEIKDQEIVSLKDCKEELQKTLMNATPEVKSCGVQTDNNFAKENLKADTDNEADSEPEQQETFSQTRIKSKIVIHRETSILIENDMNVNDAQQAMYSQNAFMPNYQPVLIPGLTSPLTHFVTAPAPTFLSIVPAPPPGPIFLNSENSATFLDAQHPTNPNINAESSPKCSGKKKKRKA